MWRGATLGTESIRGSHELRVCVGMRIFLTVLRQVLRSLAVSSLALMCTTCLPSTDAAAFGREPYEPSAGDADVLGPLFGTWRGVRSEPYALDSVARWLEPGERLTCDQKNLEQYRGTTLRYAGAVVIDPAFEERLRRFEEVAAETAREVYGREPKLIRHYGAFSCRPTRNRKHRVSEHALGNALDLVGFDFGAATKAFPLPEGLPKQLRWPFQVRVARHWRPTPAGGAAAQLHARFLGTLTERLQARSDIFRSMFGPGHGGHDDHLHLDAGPWRYVDL